MLVDGDGDGVWVGAWRDMGGGGDGVVTTVSGGGGERKSDAELSLFPKWECCARAT